MTILCMGLLNFHSTYKIVFVVHLKCSSFWHLADVKPRSSDLVHARLRQCMFALSLCHYNLYALVSVDFALHGRLV
jgi:hypothetical protein